MVSNNINLTMCCHFAPLADFLWAPVDGFSSKKKMTSCLYSIIDIKSKSNKEYKLFCRAENSFCITGGLCITRSVIVI